MKSKMAIFLIFVLFATLYSYSETMIIHKSDGTTESYNTSEISFVDFDMLSIGDFQNLNKIFGNLKNFPNPFNPTTTIEFELTKTSETNVTIYNVKGEKVKSLADERMEAGKQRLMWTGKDDKGKKVSSGVYFYKISTDGKTETKKMLLIK